MLTRSDFCKPAFIGNEVDLCINIYRNQPSTTNTIQQVMRGDTSADKMPDTEQGQGLHYSNMYAVCSGNRGRRHTRKTSDYTCDAIQSWIYAGLIWSGAFGCLIAALNFRNADKDEPDKK